MLQHVNKPKHLFPRYPIILFWLNMQLPGTILWHEHLSPATHRRFHRLAADQCTRSEREGSCAHREAAAGNPSWRGRLRLTCLLPPHARPARSAMVAAVPKHLAPRSPSPSAGEGSQALRSPQPAPRRAPHSLSPRRQGWPLAPSLFPPGQGRAGRGGEKARRTEGGRSRLPGWRASVAPHLPQRPRHGWAGLGRAGLRGAARNRTAPSAPGGGAAARMRPAAPGSCGRPLEDTAEGAGLRMRRSCSCSRCWRAAREAGRGRAVCACAEWGGGAQGRAVGPRACALSGRRAPGGGSVRPGWRRRSRLGCAQAGPQGAGVGPARRDPPRCRKRVCAVPMAAEPRGGEGRGGGRGAPVPLGCPAAAGAAAGRAVRPSPVKPWHMGPGAVCTGAVFDLLEPRAFRWAGCAVAVHCSWCLLHLEDA